MNKIVLLQFGGTLIEHDPASTFTVSVSSTEVHILHRGQLRTIACGSASAAELRKESVLTNFKADLATVYNSEGGLEIIVIDDY